MHWCRPPRRRFADLGAQSDRLQPTALIIDMTAPPGSCDLSHATTTGRKVIWARALGRRAPITVGASQWLGIARIIDEILAKGTRDES